STKDTRPQALAEFIERAVGLTRVLAKDAYRALPDPWLYRGQPTVDLQQSDGKFDSITPADRKRAAQAIEEAVRSVPGQESILSVTSAIGDNRSEMALVHSNGFEGTETRTGFSLSSEVSVKDVDGRRPEDYDYATARHFVDLPK